MPDRVLLVNGVPGSGKTALAGPLARRLGMPLIAKDAVKEALFDATGGTAPRGRLSVLASATLWSLAATYEGPVVLESFWATGRDEPHLRRGLTALGSPTGLELWCEVPLEIAFERFRSRERHAVHVDGSRSEEWWALTSTAAPISGLPVRRVPTGEPVDVGALATRIAPHLLR